MYYGTFIIVVKIGNFCPFLGSLRFSWVLYFLIFQSELYHLVPKEDFHFVMNLGKMKREIKKGGLKETGKKNE